MHRQNRTLMKTQPETRRPIHSKRVQDNDSQEVLVPQSSIRSEQEDAIDDSSSVANSMPDEESELDDAASGDFNGSRLRQRGNAMPLGGPRGEARPATSTSKRSRAGKGKTAMSAQEARMKDANADRMFELVNRLRYSKRPAAPRQLQHKVLTDRRSASGPLEDGGGDDELVLDVEVVPVSDATAVLTQSVAQDFTSIRYAEALHEGFGPLIKELWEQEVSVANRPSLDTISFEEFSRMALPVLATIPTCFLREILDNNLAHAHLGEQKSDVCAVVKSYNSPWVLENVAVVYMIMVADDDGLGPTWEEWTMIVKMITSYMNYEDSRTLDVAWSIDRNGHPRHVKERNQYGWRRYLPPHYVQGKPKPPPDAPASVRYADSKPPLEKVNRMMEFVQAIRWRLSQGSDLGPNEPLTFNYVGYSYKASQRWAAHDSGTSNAFMGITLAAAQVLYHRRNFKLRKYVVVPLANEQEAAMAEVLVAALGNSYYKSGYGFNIAGAGESNDSFEKFTLQQKINSWNWIEKNSPRLGNLEEQVRQLQARTDEKTSRVQETSKELGTANVEKLEKRDELADLRAEVTKFKLQEARLLIARKKRHLALGKFEAARLELIEELHKESSVRRKKIMALMEEAITPQQAASQEWDI